MIKLLLVEDDANLRYIIQSALDEVIVSDIEMPIMNGYEMVSRICDETAQAVGRRRIGQRQDGERSGADASRELR